MTERYINVMEILGILSASNISNEITKMYEALLERDFIAPEEIYQINEFLYRFQDNPDFSDIVNYAIELLKSLVTCNNLIVTHNGRMRCILYDILFSVDVNVNSNFKFKNCAILRLKFRRQYEMIYSSLCCIYNDEVNDEIDYKFNDTETRLILANLNILPEDIIGEVNFFIVRHCEGYYNTDDELLSEEGYRQSLNAGNFMESYLIKHKIYINNLFCSDLKRTRQTLGYMMMNMERTLNDIIEIIVLPCSHELDPKECSASENQIPCKITDYDSDLQCETLACFVYNDKTRIPVNWKHYLEFYGGHQRGIVSFFDTGCNCQSTSLFSIALGILQKTKISVWITKRL